jgi:hypothetical protein
MEAPNLLSQHSDLGNIRLLSKSDLYSGCLVQILARTPTVLMDASCGFLQSLQVNSITSFHILSNSLFTVIQLFITVKSELVTELLNKLKINK